MNMHRWIDLMDPSHELQVRLQSKIRMHPGEKTDLRDFPLFCRPYLLLYFTLAKQVCPRAVFCPAKPAESTEVLTDIGDMNVLVSDKGHPVTVFLPAELICCTKEIKHLRARD